MKYSWRFFLSVVLGFSSNPAFSADGATTVAPEPVKAEAFPKITNMAEIGKDLKLERFKGRKFNRKIKIAILDKGFYNWKAEKGKTIPEDTKYIDGKETQADKIPNTESHGTFLAILVASVLKQSGAEVDYQLFLYNTVNYSKFEFAVKDVMTEQVDIVLHSQTYEYGGNGDGKGYINTMVNNAINDGIIWINASGDFAQRMYQGGVETDGDWLKLKRRADKGVKEGVATTDGIRVKCTAPNKQQCLLRLVLMWNDVADDADTGTDKDLDLFLCRSPKDCEKGEDEKNPVRIKKSTLVQKKSGAAKGETIYPRELLETFVPSGTYFVRVKNNSKNFTEKDRIRITVSGPGIEMVDRVEGDTLTAPADNEKAIVVGASDSVNTATSKTRPDVNVKAKVNLASKKVAKGQLKGSELLPESSAAAALVAGVVALHIGTDTDKKRDAVLTQLKVISKPLSTTPASTAKKPSTSVVPEPVVGDGSRKTSNGDAGSSRASNSGTKRGSSSSRRTPRYGPSPQYNNGGGADGDAWQQQGQDCARIVSLEPNQGVQEIFNHDPSATAVRYLNGIAVLTQMDVRNVYRLGPIMNQPSDRFLFATPYGLRTITRDQLLRADTRGFYWVISTNEVSVCQ